MKKNKILLFGILLCVTTLLVGCTNEVGEEPIKTTFYQGETANIDHYQVVYNGHSRVKNKLYVNFVITNNADTSKEINLKEDFVLYTNDYEKIINDSEEKKLEIKSTESKEVQVVIESDELYKNKKQINIDSYKVIFYSNVVSNNIAFIIEESE